MKIIALHFARLLGAFVVLYAALLGVSLALAPNTMGPGPLDTGVAHQTLFMTQPKYMMLNRDRLADPKQKVLLIGASNTVMGFRQSVMSALLPNAPVHNVAIGGANISEIRQSVDFINEVQSPAARRKNIYVVGIWYGLFADDEVKWHTSDRHGGDTDLDIEAYRYGFYRRTESGAAPLLPPQYLPAGVVAIHPFLAFDYGSRQFNNLLGKLGIKHQKPEFTDEVRNQMVVSESERATFLAFWNDSIKRPHLADEQFAELKRLIDGVLADGGQIVVVDLPIPHWHAQASPYQAEYRERTDRLMGGYANQPQVDYVKIQGVDADDNFYDEVHPKPRIVPEWCRQVAAAVKLRVSALQSNVQTDRNYKS
jgi:hypothetical protein